MSAATLEAPPLDPAGLDRLAEDTEDAAFARAFAARWLRLLERRVTRIETALVAADLDAAMDALLSLRVSSTYVGARDLTTLATDVEDAVRRMDLGAARRRSCGLRKAADRASRALDAHLSPRD